MKYKKKTVCIQGKGHSGTRLFADTLDQSGIFMGEKTKRRHQQGARESVGFSHLRSNWKFVGDTMDKEPYGHINEIYNISLPFVSQRSFSDWDFSKMSNGDIPRSVKDIYTDYLSDIENSNNDFVGWKMTESMLFYPWTVRLFPDWYYIHIVRDVRAHFFRRESSDDMAHTKMFNQHSENIPKDSDGNIRADIKIGLNWKYQLDLIDSLPRPENFLQVKFEDFLLNQDHELERMSDFLGVKLLKLPVHPEKAHQWKIELEQGASSLQLAQEKISPSFKRYHVPVGEIDSSQYSFLNDHMRNLNYPGWDSDER
tara:strand:+ start:44 stop:979 length:936 start_codon:yes stop_codon:yes gene_type:complete